MAKVDRGDQHPLIHRLPIKRDGKVIAYKECASFRGLLHMGHESGLHRVETTLVQVPAKDNGETAIVQATVHITKGAFTAIGDANPKNVNPKVAPHVTRMAETRAVARALRVALDIGVVALEELEADLDEGLTYEGAIMPAGTSRPPAHDDRDGNGQRPAERPAPSQGTGGGSYDYRASDAQRKFLFRLVHEAGYVGDAAREFLHKELGVGSVKEASKGAVSALIDRLKSGDIAKSNGHASGAAE